MSKQTDQSWNIRTNSPHYKSMQQSYQPKNYVPSGEWCYNRDKQPSRTNIKHNENTDNPWKSKRK